MRKILHSIAVLYILASVIALMLIPASLNGWFGMEPDPLSAIFAYVLALPWVLLLNLLPAMSTGMAAAVAGLAMALNALILLGLARRFDNRSRSGPA